MPEAAPYRPELLAPAGKAETFFAALDAGADAVYLGLDRFNARLKSENFTLRDLSRLLPYAHERGRRVYVTLNTLIKQAELPDAVSALSALAALGVDAVIIADWGLIALTRDRFPGLRVHASTQMGVHNSAGAATAERLGCRRVILARELTREELGLVRRRSRVELEVFVHGALCYSLSGFCLASSFIGGAGGNRGLCTQVCRRGFRVRGQPGGHIETPFFSPLDLQLLERLPDLMALKIDAFKIEGRLKGGAYVRTVVSAYRRAIDRPETIPDLTHELRRDFGRAKTTFFFDSGRDEVPAHIIQAPDQANAVGVPLGQVIEAEDRRVVIKTTEIVLAGDALRIQPQTGREGKRHTVASVESKNGRWEIMLHTPSAARPGDPAFLVDRKDRNADTPRLPPPQAYSAWPYAKALAAVLAYGSAAKRPRPAPSWSLRMDDPDWLPLAAATEARRLILDLAEADGPAVDAIASLKAAERQRITAGVPVFVPETDLEAWRRTVQRLRDLGVTRFTGGNPGLLLGLFERPPSGVVLEAGPGANALNVPARALLRSLGVEKATLSLEDDLLNIRNSGALPAACTVYGPVPLFISRVDPGLKPEASLYDRNDNAFLAARRGGLYYLIGKHPLCLFHKREKLVSLGVVEFIIDVSFTSPDRQKLAGLLDAFQSGRRPLPSTLFNFKRELT